MHDAFLSRRSLLLLIALLAVAWFGTLDYRALIRPDEGRYAEIAREMAVSGDLVTPRLNGIKYFEKPPLQYWVTAAAFKGFGEHGWTARIWPAATGFLCLLLVFFTGRRLFGADAGLLAAAVLASSLLFVMIGHFNTLDMGLAFFLQLAISGFLFAQGEAQPRRRLGWMLLAWLALALATLSKGPVSLLLPGAALVAYSALSRDHSPWRRLHFAWGLPLLLLVATPWFVAVSVANPEFPGFFFIHEHIQRFLTTVHRRYEPWWFFLPVFAAGALPWTLMMLQALAGAWRTPAEGLFQPKRFLLVWSVVTFLFFSASDSKLASYILPIFPALALLTGERLARLERRALALHVGAVALLAAAMLFLLPNVMGFLDEEATNEMLSRYVEWLMASATILLGGALAGLWLVRLSRPRLAVVMLAASAFAGGMGALLGHESLSATHSAKCLAERVLPLLPKDVPMYSVKMYDQTMPFYLKRTMTLVSHQDEMAFGLEQEPEKWIPSVEAFQERWRTDHDAFAMMGKGTYEQLLDAGLQMDVVATDARHVVARKPGPLAMKHPIPPPTCAGAQS